MNTWSRLAGMAVLGAALIACSHQESPTAVTEQPVTGTQEAPDAAARASRLEKPLAKGVRLGFSHHLRRDRIEETRPGVFRRRVLLEYLALDQQQAASALIADMSEGGYKVVSERVDDQGRIRLTFQKGKRKISAHVRNGGKVEHEAAKGTILVSIPAKAPKPKTA